MFNKYPFKLTASIFLVMFCALSSFVYLTLGSGSINSLIEQMLHREQIIARSGAKSIQSIVELGSNSLLLLANDENITPTKLKKFINIWANTPIVGIYQSDKKGQIIAAYSNVENVTPGGNVADRDYFKIASNYSSIKIILGKPVISRVPGANSSYKIPIVSPIFKNGQFNGVITISISIPILSKNYLEPLKISDQTDIILIDNHGNFLGSLHPKLIGDNIQNYFSQHPFLGDKVIYTQVKDKIKDNSEQKFDIVIPNLNTDRLTRTLIALSPVDIGNDNHWTLVVLTPVSDALVFIYPYILRNLLGIIFSFFVSIFVTILIFKYSIKK